MHNNNFKIKDISMFLLIYLLLFSSSLHSGHFAHQIIQEEITSYPITHTQTTRSILRSIRSGAKIEQKDIEFISRKNLPLPVCCFKIERKGGSRYNCPFYKETLACKNWDAFFQLMGETIVIEKGKEIKLLNLHHLDNYHHQDPHFTKLKEALAPDYILEKYQHLLAILKAHKKTIFIETTPV